MSPILRLCGKWLGLNRKLSEDGEPERWAMRRGSMIECEMCSRASNMKIEVLAKCTVFRKILEEGGHPRAVEMMDSIIADIEALPDDLNQAGSNTQEGGLTDQSNSDTMRRFE
jgi:hypothetical protein